MPVFGIHTIKEAKQLPGSTQRTFGVYPVHVKVSEINPAMNPGRNMSA
jgi:hypothetical protein